MTTLDPTHSPAALSAPRLPREFFDLTSRLDALAARFRLAQTLQALAGFLSVTGALAVAVLFAGGYFALPTWIHILLLLVLASGVATAYALFLHGPLFRRPSYAEIARLVEHHGSAPVDNALINAVLLAQDYHQAAAAGAPQGSAAWIPDVLREAGTTTAALPLENAVPWRQPRNAWLLALLVLAGCAIVVGLTPGTFAHGWAVLMQPTRFVPHQGAVRIIEVIPGNDTALAGQTLAFSVTVDSPQHKTVPATLQIHFASGKDVAYAMSPFGAENNQYIRQGLIAAEDLDYTITAGDTQSGRFHITVLPQIHLLSFTLEAAPPAYTGHEKQTLTLNGKEATAARGSLDVPLGSQITLTISLDGPAKEVLLDAASDNNAARPPIALTPRPDGRTFSTSLRLRDTLHYILRVNDGANRTLQRFPAAPASNLPAAASADGQYSLTALPDSPPTVSLTEPGRDLDAKPGDKITLTAQAADDYGLTELRLEIAKNGDKEFHTARSWPLTAKDGKATRSATIHHQLELPATDYKFGDTLRYRFVATDNRDLTQMDATLGPQSTPGQVFTISFNDTSATAAKTSKLWDELRQKLSALLDRQIALRKQAAALLPTISINDVRTITAPISQGQKSMRDDLAALARDFPFETSMKLVQKSLQVLAVGDAAGAIDRSGDILLLSDAKSLSPLATRLRQHQSRIIDVLQTLLAIAAADQKQLASTADHEGGDIPSDARDAWKKLADELKKFDAEQKAVIDATADLAKKPKDQFDANDQKKLAAMAAVEDKWEKFLNERLADMSKIAEQDMANASLLEEMVQMKVELATSKDALDQKATEIATPLEENGLEKAAELTTHIERWLQQQPDRKDWQMEEPLTQDDPKMAPLPAQLQDMVGDLMDKEEDLTPDMESLASKSVDSIDKGAGWDAADGPISNMSAQGVTGNQMPKDMEIQGRSGEGREGRSSGEMVGNEAEGKEGRRTPTRLTNDPFSNSQVTDKSQLPAGGATGGGKKGQLGGEGLEGPAPADDPSITQRLAGQQSSIRNEAERLALQMHAAGFDNFKLMESNAYLKKSADALQQNHYQTALYYQQEAVQSLNTAKVLAAGEIHVIADTSPVADEKTRKDVDSALNGPMPKGYADPVRAYFEKMATAPTSPPVSPAAK